MQQVASARNVEGITCAGEETVAAKYADMHARAGEESILLEKHWSKCKCAHVF